MRIQIIATFRGPQNKLLVRPASVLQGRDKPGSGILLSQSSPAGGKGDRSQTSAKGDMRERDRGKQLKNLASRGHHRTASLEEA